MFFKISSTTGADCFYPLSLGKGQGVRSYSTALIFLLILYQDKK